VKESDNVAVTLVKARVSEMERFYASLKTLRPSD
jgi:hypothetical protein